MAKWRRGGGRRSPRWEIVWRDDPSVRGEHRAAADVDPGLATAGCADAEAGGGAAEAAGRGDGVPAGEGLAGGAPALVGGEEGDCGVTP